MGGTKNWPKFPTFMQLFGLFWTSKCLKKIVTETNQYVKVVHGDGHIEGGPLWYDITVAKLKAFIALSFYMDLKKQPNYKSYWMEVGSVFHFPVISNIMSCDHFETLLAHHQLGGLCE
jgi:hypothetical protein